MKKVRGLWFRFVAAALTVVALAAAAGAPGAWPN